MGVCELCGSGSAKHRARVEGTELAVCSNCAGYGQVVREVRAPIKKKVKPVKQEKVEVVVDDFAEKIRGAREKQGYTQKEFAKQLNERESIIHKIETGAFVPSITLARKLEKRLRIKLVEEEPEHTPIRGKKSEGFTIGDVIKLEHK